MFPDQPPDLAAVRAALRLAHHEADDRPHRLVVAAADLLRGALVGGDRGRDDPGQLVAAAGEGEDGRAAANWVTDLRARIGAEADPAASAVSARALAQLVAMVAAGQVNAGAARQVLDRLVAEGGEPAAIVEREGLGTMGGGDELSGVVAAAIAANGAAAEKVRAGNDKAMGPIVGFVMRETKGRADGGEVGRLVREQLGV